MYQTLSWVGRQFGRMATFREWSFGRYSEIRQPQRADLPSDVLLPDARNLAMVLNRLEFTEAGPRFNDQLRQFLPRYERYATRVESGTVQLYLHERGMREAIPATRLSDGTIRFLAILAVLLDPAAPPLVCIEEPELGLHPDAVAQLAKVMVEASGRMQLIVTTHSDVLVSALSDLPESILVVEHLGRTVVERLSSDSVSGWLEDYKLGEVWRRGALGGNP